MTREATSKKIANSKLRWSSARTKSFENAALLPGGSALFYKSVARRSAPERRGPAVILDFDETGVTLKFQSQTSDVGRLCVGKRVEPKDIRGLGWDPASGLDMDTDVWPSLIRGGAPRAYFGC